MSNFTDAEIKYLQSQRLGRLATVNKAGEPHVVPVTFRYNPEQDTIDIGGRDMGNTKKFRDILQNENVAFVIDDSPTPGQGRFLEVRGRAEQVADGGKAIVASFTPEIMRIFPRRIVAGGMDAKVGESRYFSSRKVGD